MSDRSVLDALSEGNARFMTGDVRPTAPLMNPDGELPAHRPVAVVVACSDARVPVERVFDQAAGALFVVRVAGQVLEPAGLASVHFAVAGLGARVVVVLGHEACGAVQAALTPGRHEALAALVDPIRHRIASVETVGAPSEDKAIRDNVLATVGEIGAFLEHYSGVAAGDIVVVGAVHMLRTGKVEWLD